MNIFFLSVNPAKCAKYHCNSHVVKMIVEYCQLLSTAHRVLDPPNDFHLLLYKATHANHPSAIWVRQGKKNYLWLHNLLSELCKEYTFRYGKIHKCESSGLVQNLRTAPSKIPLGGSPLLLAMPDDVRFTADPVRSYRTFYAVHKKHLLTWTNRDMPAWLNKFGYNEQVSNRNCK